MVSLAHDLTLDEYQELEHRVKEDMRLLRKRSCEASKLMPVGKMLIRGVDLLGTPQEGDPRNVSVSMYRDGVDVTIHYTLKGRDPRHELGSCSSARVLRGDEEIAGCIHRAKDKSAFWELDC